MIEEAAPATEPVPAPNTAVGPSHQRRVVEFEQMWNRALPIVAKLVPKHIDPNHVFAIALTASQRDPRLMDCTDLSVLRCAILSAQFGLDVSGIGGKAYMIPYWNKDLQKNEARFQFGFRGLIELAMRSGRIAAIYSREVYQDEPFEYREGLVQVLNHVPGAGGGEVVAAYAVAVHQNSYRQPEVMFRHQIDRRRMVSKAADGPAWTNWFPEMAQKTVIRQLCKKLPDSAELSYALDLEDRADLGLPPAAEVDLTPLEEQTPAQAPPTRTDKVKAQVSKSRKARAAEESADDREPGEEG